MKAFRFRLETLLRVRRLELERACVALAQAERSRARAGTRVEEWQRRVTEAAGMLTAQLGTGLRADAYRTAEAGLRTLRGRLAEALGGVEHARREVTEARARVLGSRTRVRALERLRARAEREHRQGLARWEQRQLDEIALQRGEHRELQP